ncbi:MAG: DUF4417 domain-containing protein [Clostridiales bacterium]
MKPCRNDCNSCSYYNYCRGCSYCEALICNRRCNLCETVCLNKNGIDNYLKYFNDFNINISKNYYKELPMNIPVIPAKIKKTFHMDFVAVNGSRLLSRNGEKINKHYLERGFRGVLNLLDGTSGILELYIKDRQLEGFWDKRKNLYKDLKKLDFEFIIVPNFSIYEDLPRIEHLYNIKRNSIVYNELLENGINAIADISWFSKSDIDKWIFNINKNKIKLISFSFQNVGTSLKASNNWKCNLLGFKYLCENIENDVDILIAGIASPIRLIEIYKSINKENRLMILNQSAFIQSRRAVLSELQSKNYDMSFDDILTQNLDYYTKIYEKIYKSDKLLNLNNLSIQKISEIYRSK